MSCLEENNKDLLGFINSIKRVNGPRKHKVKNSYGVYDGYKYYRKNKPKDKKYILTESQYFSIIRKVNEILADNIALGEDVVLPSRLGRIEIRKYRATIAFKDGKLINNLPIDWNATLKLWYEDKQAYKDKTIIKQEDRDIFKIYYNKNKAEYNNKSFYEFNINRELKKKLKTNIKEGKVDAFLL